MATDDLHFRAATEDDLARVLEIHVVAFPDGRPEAARRQNFTASRFGGLGDLVLACRAGEIVGQAFLFPLEAWFGGRPVRMGGVASLSVAPEAREQGVATSLLHHLHVASDVRGDAVTMLYAFRQRFYARLGYGQSASRKLLVIDPDSVPSSWRALARGAVRPARAADMRHVAAAYSRAAAKASGWLTRSEADWKRRFARARTQVLVVDGPEGGAPVAGYVAFEIVQDEAHAATSIVVEELATDDDVTRLALVGALALMRGQAVEIALEVDAADPLELGLIDSDGRRFGTERVEHELGAIVGGPMVRIEDVPRALESRGYAADGAFDVVVDAGEGASNGAGEEIAVSVSVADGRAHVSAARGAAGAIRTTRAGLASLLYGGLRLSDAARLRLAEADPRTVARVEPILAIAPPAPLDPF